MEQFLPNVPGSTVEEVLAHILPNEDVKLVRNSQKCSIKCKKEYGSKFYQVCIGGINVVQATEGHFGESAYNAAVVLGELAKLGKSRAELKEFKKLLRSGE